MPLTPNELERLPEGADPADYMALDVDPVLSDRHPVTGATIQSPAGLMEVILIPWLLPVPLAYVVQNHTLDANGLKRNPLDGMVPYLSARFVVPRKCLVPGVLALLDPEEERRAARDKQILDNARLAELVPALAKAARRVVDMHGSEYDMDDLAAALEALDPKVAVPLPKLRLAGGRDMDAMIDGRDGAAVAAKPDDEDEPSNLTDINATRIWREP